jgi:hypothetical protein
MTLRESKMNEKKTCIVTTPVTTFDNGNITVMLSMVVDPKALLENAVSLENFRDYLCFTVYLVPTDRVENDKISIDFDSLFIPVNGTTEQNYINLFSKVEESIACHLTDNSDDVIDILGMITSKVDEVKEQAAEMFQYEVQAYLTND